MAPSPQETIIAEEPKSATVARPLTGEEVVISGMSGIFPNSDSTQALMENLFNKVDMVGEQERWDFNHPEVPKYLGTVNGMGKFDAQFFRVHYKQGCTMEPMSRKLLEHAYSAIYDSGVNLQEIAGKKVGVFIGSTFSESEKIIIYENIQKNGFGITGCNKAMYANRISYWIDGKGPSYALDLACASSMACLEHAYRTMSTGQCDAAIVGGCNLCMHPNVSLNLKRAGYLCLDGKTKVFDKKGDGYVRSDAISVLFLQKAKDAKRIYSEVYYAKCQYSSIPNENWQPIREERDIRQFLEQFYSDINVSPKDVEYVEAHGTAIAVADGNELEAIGKVFGKETPIKVGSVKSNMGHSEPASGVCAVTKVCLAYHKGQLPANLNYTEPQDHIPSVRDGKVDILQEHAPFNRGFAALNSFSYSGANVHVLLKGRYKPKDPERYKSSIPHIVLISGRQESCVKIILDSLAKQAIDPEQIGLLHNIHKIDISGHMCRGYTIIDTDENKETVCLAEKADYYSGIAKPLWFVYSGMGSQWAGMGADLMRIPIFASAIQKCHKVLEPRGIDIVKILTEPDKKIYDNILNSFVGIAAVQIGLTDILREMGIVPDNIIGHSVGELGCAYADGCFTAEEMILSAYSRGLVSIQTPLIRGSMAAIGLGFEFVLALCPPEIEVACHNSSESSTISGPADIMKQFVTELTDKGIFAKEVPCSNIAYHSKYISAAGPGLRQYLSEVIRDPKPRSEKWVSTSVPQDKWGEPEAKYSSAEYHTNNLLNSVLFEETARQIPENALVIEIAPHGLLQAILKRSHSECTHVPLTRRGHAKPVQFLLEAIGKLFQEGLTPKVDVLYPKIEYPVATETPLLSHLVEWEHSEDYPQAKYNSKFRVVSAARKFVMSIHDDDYKYIKGCVRNGNIVFPEAAQLVLVWETLAMYKGVNYKDMSVAFSDVQFHEEAHIKTEEPFKLGIIIYKGNNRFEVTHEKVIIMSGYILQLKGIGAPNPELQEFANEEVLLTASDIYKMMRLKGFTYKNEFQSIVSTNLNRNLADIKWNDEWVTFLDSLIQLKTFSRDHDGVSVLKVIKKLTISTPNHKTEWLALDKNKPYLKAHIDKILDNIRCAGVKISYIAFTDKSKIEQEPDVLETVSFIPHLLTGDVDVNTALSINLQIIAENMTKNEIKLTEIVNNSTSISKVIQNAAVNIPTVNFNISTIEPKNIDLEVMRESDVFVLDNLLCDEMKMNKLYNVIPKDSFILTLEENTSEIKPKYKHFNILSSMSVQKKLLLLLNKAESNQNENIKYFPINHDINFSWVSQIQSEMKKPRRLVLVSEKQSYCGILGIVKKINKSHQNNNKIRLVVVDGFSAPTFNPEERIYRDQLEKNLTINILKAGKWGGYYNRPSVKLANLQNIKLTSAMPGDIDTLTWTEVTAATSNNLVKICYAGLSSKDAQSAVGMVKSDEKDFGMDFSGINIKGQKVMGLVRGGAVGNFVEADPDLLWPVPKHWSLEEAATVPLPFIHAYYCLAMINPLIKGKSVFITGGAGALGQAVIAICLDIDCTVYTTVGDNQKKRFLHKMFPKLDVNNIGCSRDDSFYNMVIANSKGQRCNIVINCLTGHLRRIAMKCTGFSGLFIDVSDFDMRLNKSFDMACLGEERNYYARNVGNLFRPESVEQRKALQLMISEGIAKGIVRPISRVVYPPNDVTKAFRILSACKNRGRVLIRMKDPVTVSQELKAQPRMIYSSTSTYIVVCDEKSLGIELVDRLVTNGARKVIIHIKTKANNGYFQIKLASWKEQNATIEISSEKLQTEGGCANLLKESKKLGPLEAIFIVEDSGKEYTDNLEPEDFSNRFNETALVVANLDLTSRNICSELGHFVVITRSSKAIADDCAMSMSEKICQRRTETGFPALYFHISLLDELDEDLEDVHPKLQLQSISTVFNSLEASLRMNYNDVISYNLKKQSNYDVYRKLAKILGQNNLEGIPENVTFNDLGLHEISIEEVKALLRDRLQTNFSVERIQEMTIAEVKEIICYKDLYGKHTKGLGAFYTFIEKDECTASEPMVAMPTILSNASEKEEEMDPKAKYLMLMPGFEGHHQVFTTLCDRLKVQAMVFQLGPDLTGDSVPEMAANIMKFIKARFELKSKFYLLGYSFGVNIALELAALLEKEGYVGIVHCLDSSPDALRVQLDTHVGNLSDVELQNAIVEHMYSLMTGKVSKELKEDLKNIESWSEKIEACVTRLRGLVNYSNQYKRCLLQNAYERIKLARNYKPNIKLESEIVLMKGIAHRKVEKLAEDYGLSKYSKQPVKIFNLAFDHVLAPFDCRVTNIVNKFLEPEVLEEFKQKNLCESYLAEVYKVF